MYRLYEYVTDVPNKLLKQLEVVAGDISTNFTSLDDGREVPRVLSRRALCAAATNVLCRNSRHVYVCALGCDLMRLITNEPLRTTILDQHPTLTSLVPPLTERAPPTASTSSSSLDDSESLSDTTRLDAPPLSHTNTTTTTTNNNNNNNNDDDDDDDDIDLESLRAAALASATTRSAVVESIAQQHESLEEGELHSIDASLSSSSSSVSTATFARTDTTPSTVTLFWFVFVFAPFLKLDSTKPFN
jgi:hypothetical protein